MTETTLGIPWRDWDREILVGKLVGVCGLRFSGYPEE
jgi:hypothetical protein